MAETAGSAFMSDAQQASEQLFAFRDEPEAIRLCGQRSRTAAVIAVLEMHDSMLSAAREIERLQKRIRELEAVCQSK